MSERSIEKTGRGMRLALYSDASEVGGAEIVAGHLLAELDDSIEVVVLGIDSDVVDAIASRRPGTAVRRLPRVRDKRDPRAIWAHIRTLRSLRPDALHVNRYSPWSGQYALLAGLLTSTPVVAVEHAVYPSTSAVQRRLSRVLCSSLAAHVAVGVRTARRVEQEIGLPLEQVMRDRPGPLVGWMGRISTVKGLDVLLQALTAVPEASCVLVGDGPERRSLEQLARELDIEDRVVITGWVDQPRDYLPSFDVVALPSRFDSLPLVIIEAMLAQRPVIASDVGGVSELVVDGVTGVLVPSENPQALGSAIAGLLDQPSLIAKMGVRARERALECFSSQAMARSYEALYRRVLK
jgi:hypothetical protein